MEKLQTQKPSLSRTHRVKRWAIGCYRLGVILAALACLWALPRDQRAVDPGTVLAEAKSVFPAAAAVGEPYEGFYPLLDDEGNAVGWATSTFPQAAKLQGYSGASELLVIFDANQVVRGVRFLSSEDTDGHVRKIRDDADFWEQWTGEPESSLGANSQAEIVSGASLTSEAMARGLAARFGAEGMDQWFPDLLELADVAKWFPEADRIEDGSEAGSYRIFIGDEKLGAVLRSSRMGVSARGFNGISDVIVSLGAEGKKVLGIGFLDSRDNEPYICRVGRSGVHWEKRLLQPNLPTRRGPDTCRAACEETLRAPSEDPCDDGSCAVDDARGDLGSRISGEWRSLGIFRALRKLE